MTHHASRSSWSPFDAPRPTPNRDISRLLSTDSSRSDGFESYVDAEVERKRRISTLRQHPSPHGSKTAERLAGCEPALRCLSPSCPICFRRMRIWWYAELAELLMIADLARSTLQIITLVHQDWILPRDRISDFNPGRLIDCVRHQLLRAGAKGSIVVGAIHGEFDTRRQYWQPHLHLAARGLSRDILSLLRHRHYQRAPLVYRPMFVQPLIHPAPQLSYLFKSYWPLRARYLRPDGREASTFRRIPDPLMSEWLIAADRSRLLDFIFLLGVRRQGHRLVRVRHAQTV